MQAISTLSFPTPCSIVQSQFTQKTQGSKYHAYEKQVVDYTGMSNQELLQALLQNSTGCGFFRAVQLERPLIEGELATRGYSIAAFALLLALQLCSINICVQDIPIKPLLTK